MNKLIDNDLIIEKRDFQSLSYILKDESLLFKTGYKVLQNQEKNGFIKCIRVTHNGKIKLVYDCTGYKTLSDIISTLKPASFLLIINNFVNVLNEVKSNGFMKCQNIDIDLNKIFVDCSNYNIKLIYLPVESARLKIDTYLFEAQVKKMILAAIVNNSNLNSQAVVALKEVLVSRDSSLEDIKHQLTNNRNNINQIEDRIPSSKEINEEVHFNDINAIDNERSRFNVSYEDINNRKTKDKKGIFDKVKGLFKGDKSHSSGNNTVSNGNKVTMPNRVATNEPIVNNFNYSAEFQDGDTEVLDDFDESNLKLVCINIKSRFELIVNKPEYVIGKNPEVVDGVIPFNKAISRVHCKITKFENKYYIEDLGSSNGTYINEHKIPVRDKIEIRNADKITLANSDFLVEIY